MRLRHVFPVTTEHQYLGVMKTLSSAVGFSDSDVAALRLRCVTLLQEHGYSAVLTAYPSVSRASVFRWKKKLAESQGKLSALLPHSTRPHAVRAMFVPMEILQFL